ncbi:MAG: putative 2-dehydropantoate 2-reductase [Phycisphaerales bacterium]|jgi:2-dehydropantoate 2-reductase|nr:putative 2-dehydropantoate 2-reductase [Phycisphaerales bacterium]
MSLDQPAIAIIGSGAVGGYYGSRLAQAGHDLHFLLRSDYDAVRTNGWTIHSCDGDFSLTPDQFHAYNDPTLMPKADLVLVTLKATANAQLGSLIRPLLKDDTLILTLQNGLGNEEQLADLYGQDRIIGGLAFVCINRGQPGHIHHTDHGLIAIGEYQGPPTDRVRRLAGMFNSSRIRCRILDNLRHGRWEKLLWNIPFNGLGAAMDTTTDRLLASPAGIELVRDIMKEVLAVAHADGVDLDPKLIEQKIDHTRTMQAYRTSMQIDRQTGRPMELDAILGQPLRVASAHHVPMPLVQMIARQLQALDNSQNYPD